MTVKPCDVHRDTNSLVLGHEDQWVIPGRRHVPSKLNYHLTYHGFQPVLGLLLEYEGDPSWCANGEWFSALLQVDPHGLGDHGLKESLLPRTCEESTLSQQMGTYANDTDIDKVFQQEVIRKLEKNQFNPLRSSELEAKRTLIIFRGQPYTRKNEQTIKNEITTRNESANIQTVLKFPKGNILKIKFTEISKAIKEQEPGIKLFFMYNPSQDIKQENYINIMTWMK